MWKEMARIWTRECKEKSCCLANRTMSIEIHNISDHKGGREFVTIEQNVTLPSLLQGLSPTAIMNQATLLYTAILRHKDSDAISSLKLPLYVDLSTTQIHFWTGDGGDQGATATK